MASLEGVKVGDVLRVRRMAIEHFRRLSVGSMTPTAVVTNTGERFKISSGIGIGSPADLYTAEREATNENENA